MTATHMSSNRLCPVGSLLPEWRPRPEHIGQHRKAPLQVRRRVVLDEEKPASKSRRTLRDWARWVRDQGTAYWVRPMLSALIFMALFVVLGLLITGCKPSGDFVPPEAPTTAAVPLPYGSTGVGT